MEFRILGPLEVFDHGRPLSIRRGKEQALLAYLLLHANDIVPSGRLIDELWNERPPATASKILHNAVSHLRKQLGEGRLGTSGPGYVLRVEQSELDLHEFERLAKEGRPEQALALWRGTPLPDIREERFADDARRRLEEQRLAVVEARIDNELAEGRQAELVPELEQLVAEHPLRERLHEQLMLALYRAGRQSDALEAYQRVRRGLSEEVGLEPGPQLQDLERKILTHDPELGAPRRRATSRRDTRRLPIRAAAAVLVLGALLSLGLVYALDNGSKGASLVVRPNSLVAIDPARNRVVDVIPVGRTPRGVAVGRRAVWVTNATDGTISEVSLSTHKVIRVIGLAAQASDIVEAAGGLWVATGIDNGLIRIDERTGGVLGTARLTGDTAASSHAVAAGRGAVWITSGDHVLKIDEHTGAVLAGRKTLAAKTPTPACCYDLFDVAVGEGAVWIVDLSEHVARISPTTAGLTGSRNLGVIPNALTTGYGSIWVAAPENSRRLTVWRIDPQTMEILHATDAGASHSYLETLSLAVGAGSVWLASYAERLLVRIDPKSGTVVARIKLGAHPRGVTVGDGLVWVTVG